MKTWLLAAATAALLASLATPASAQQRWCARSGGGGENFVSCGFATFEACRQEILGLGGSCFVDPYSPPPRAAPSGRAPPPSARPRR